MTEPTDSPAYFRPPPREHPYGAPYDAPPALPANGPGHPPAELAPAGYGRRVLARVIDVVIVAAIAAPVTVPLLSRYLQHLKDTVDAATATSSSPALYDSTTVRLLTGIAIVTIIVSGLYEVPQLARWGQTVGKRVCRVRVIRRAGAGPAAAPVSGLGAATAAVRWLVSGVASSVPWIGGLFGILDASWMLWDRPWRQCLHDKAAATVVVRSPG